MKMLHTNILFKIGNIEWMARQHLTRHLGWQSSEWRLLAILSEMKHISKQTLNQSRIGEVLTLSPSACTRLIDRMIEKGYVIRERGKNRRTYFVALTDSGKNVWRKLSKKIEKELDNIVKTLSKKQLDEAAKILDILHNNILKLK